jgi:hypothetical protein
MWVGFSHQITKILPHVVCTINIITALTGKVTKVGTLWNKAMLRTHFKQFMKKSLAVDWNFSKLGLVKRHSTVTPVTEKGEEEEEEKKEKKEEEIADRMIALEPVLWCDAVLFPIS